MNRFIALHLLLLCLGCGNEIIPSDLNLLNGFWNIDYISHKNETFHPKGAAKLLDYYEINDRQGVRKKVQPSLNNKFLVTEDLNYFKGLFEDILFDEGFIKIFDFKKIKEFILEIS